MILKNLIKNIDICNIHLVRVDKYLLKEMFFQEMRDENEYITKPKIGKYIWVCGKHGDEGVLNDGGILYWSYSLSRLLNKIKQHGKKNNSNECKIDLYDLTKDEIIEYLVKLVHTKCSSQRNVDSIEQTLAIDHTKQTIKEKLDRFVKGEFRPHGHGIGECPHFIGGTKNCHYCRMMLSNSPMETMNEIMAEM